MRGAELEILLHLEAFDLPVVEAHVWRNRTVGEALLDRIAAAARPEDGERGTGDAVLRDPSGGAEGDLMLGEHDDIGNGLLSLGNDGEHVTPVLDTDDYPTGFP